jgi:acetyl-CoA acetyltransferase
MSTGSAISERVVISGIGQTEFSKDSGRSSLRLATEAASAAIADAGLEPADIRGTVTFTQDENDEIALASALGIPELDYTSRSRGGGGGSGSTIQQAAVAVACGVADHVLVYRAFNERSGRRFGQPLKGSLDSTWNPYRPYGLDTPMKVYGLWAQHYLDHFGLTNADLALYAVQARAYASTNPMASYYGKPLSFEEHQASRWIVEPVLRLYDCCQESDGGVALVVSRSDQISRYPSPVRIRAAVQSHLRGGHEMFNYYQGDLTNFPETVAVADKIWNEAGITGTDYDVALLYDNTTPTVLLQMEGLGICGTGEARDFIASGEIRIDGATPINTNGGLIGEGYIHGMNLITEAVRQVRGTAANQVLGAETSVFCSGRSAVVLGAW